MLFLTARDAVEDRISGLTAGARRLRHQAVQPGGGGAADPGDPAAQPGGASRRPTAGLLRYADLELDEDAHEVRRAGRLVDLSPTEFNLLRYLLINAGRVVSKAQILDRVWKYDFGGDGRIVESYVYYLRRKIDRSDPPLIHTVRGVGYALRLPRGGDE